MKDLLHIFLVEKRCSMSELFLDRPEFPRLAQAGYFKLELYPAKIVNKCRTKALQDACGERFADAVKWARSQCTPEEWEKRTGAKIYREELAKWIIRFSPEAVGVLCKGVHYIDLFPENVIELGEFFTDYLYQEGYRSSLEIYTSDERFLSPGKRRVKNVGAVGTSAHVPLEGLSDGECEG